MLCERFETCALYVASKNKVSSSDVELLTESYCEGPLQHKCSRLKHWKEHGVSPPDDWSPTGYVAGTHKLIG